MSSLVAKTNVDYLLSALTSDDYSAFLGYLRYCGEPEREALKLWISKNYVRLGKDSYSLLQYLQQIPNAKLAIKTVLLAMKIKEAHGQQQHS